MSAVSKLSDAKSCQFWWSYLGQSYPRCRRGGFLWAPGDPSHPLSRLRPGDRVVHEYRRRIVAISYILGTPDLLTAPWVTPPGGEQIWQVPVRYEDLPQPVTFADLHEALLLLEPNAGPMHTPLGSGRQGDLYPFSQDGLTLVLQATGGNP